MGTVKFFRRHYRTAYFWLELIQFLLLVAAFYAGAYVYFFLHDPGGFEKSFQALPVRSLVFALISTLCLTAMGVHHPRMREGPTGSLLRITGAFVAVILIMSVIFYFFPRLYLWRGVFMYTVVFGFITCLITWALVIKFADLSQFKRRVLIYGCGNSASAIGSAMRRKSDRRGFTVVGFVKVGDSVLVDEKLIEIDGSLAEFAVVENIDEIVVALDDRRSPLGTDELVACRTNGIVVVDLISFFEREAGKVLVDFVRPTWFIFSAGFSKSDFSSWLQRSFDFCASFLLLAISWPVMLMTMLAINLEDGFGSPCIFRQSRVGLNGKVFQVLKFRSMTVDAEGDGKARWACRDDQRITRTGRIIRKLRIDELPQIVNVLAGDMSLIGPRPERPEFVTGLSEQIPYYDMRHLVKPGITGWAQLLYPYGASDEDSKQKLQFDLYYVKNRGLFLDFLILLTTVEVVLFGKGAR